MLVLLNNGYLGNDHSLQQSFPVTGHFSITRFVSQSSTLSKTLS